MPLRVRLVGGHCRPKIMGTANVDRNGKIRRWHERSETQLVQAQTARQTRHVVLHTRNGTRDLQMGHADGSDMAQPTLQRSGDPPPNRTTKPYDVKHVSAPHCGWSPNGPGTQLHIEFAHTDRPADPGGSTYEPPRALARTRPPSRLPRILHQFLGPQRGPQAH